MAYADSYTAPVWGGLWTSLLSKINFGSRVEGGNPEGPPDASTLPLPDVQSLRRCITVVNSYSFLSMCMQTAAQLNELPSA